MRVGEVIFTRTKDIPLRISLSQWRGNRDIYIQENKWEIEVHFTKNEQEIEALHYKKEREIEVLISTKTQGYREALYSAKRTGNRDNRFIRHGKIEMLLKKNEVVYNKEYNISIP